MARQSLRTIKLLMRQQVQPLLTNTHVLQRCTHSICNACQTGCRDLRRGMSYYPFDNDNKSFGTLSSRVEKYRSITISCARCRCMLFKYKKKNGTKSALIKILINRIVEDPNGIIPEDAAVPSPCVCPKCGEAFARAVIMRGNSALKIIGNRVQMKGWVFNQAYCPRGIRFVWLHQLRDSDGQNPEWEKQ